MKYRTKPRIKEADQWFPGKEIPGVHVETQEEATAVIGGRGHGEQRFPQTPRYYVVTIHGQRAYLAPGDYVVVEPDGVHRYPCKADIFESGHDPAE